MLPLNELTEIRCVLRGKFKKDFNLKKDKLFFRDFITVGDIVDFDMNQDGTGVIFKIHERKNHISRKMPKIRGASYRGERLEQVVAANISTAFIVSSIEQPKFNFKTVDRFLVTCESCSIHPVLIINKCDLSKKNETEFFKSHYEKIGYTVIITSIITKQNTDILRNQLAGSVSLFWGQSGVGKSSILNLLFPQLNLRTGQISNFTQKGTHTTVTSKMFAVSKNTFIIDTPGIREIEPYGIKKEDLGHYFIEFAGYSSHCKFNTCTHQHEPGCAVRKAVENGDISELRFESYLKMLKTIEEDMNFS